MVKSKILWLMIPFFVLAACTGGETTDTDAESNAPPPPVGSNEVRPQRPANLETAIVAQVIDGDTVDLSGGRRVRLIGINTPEEGEYLYNEAATFTRELLEGKEVGLEPSAEGDAVDQFGRELFYIWINGLLVNYEIARAGYANRYVVQPAGQYDGFIQQAEELASGEQLGLWLRGQLGLKINSVNPNPPGPDEEDLNGETVSIQNIGQQVINLLGYTIRDDGANVYTFEAISLAPFQSLTLHTGCGLDNPQEIYWCSDAPIWNNSGDTVFLNDPDGLYVDHRDIIGQ
jgi:endonuclease YncB( thermonuclease family)